MQTPAVVTEFLSQRHIAVAGVSRNPRKWGNVLFREFRKRGYEVIPLNPTATEVEGVRAYTSLREIPRRVEALLVATPANAAKSLVEDALAAGVSRIWFQKGAGAGSASSEALELCRATGMKVVTGSCPMMFLQPVAFPHAVHAWWRHITGKFRKGQG